MEIGWTSHTEISIFEGRIIQPNYEVKHDGTSVDPFRCYGIVNPTEPQEFFWIFRQLLKTYSLESIILVRDGRIPDIVTTGEAIIQKMSGRHGRKYDCLTAFEPVRLLSIEEQILKWLQKLELIDSYTLNPTSNTDQRVRIPRANSTKMVPKSDSQTLVSVFPKSCH